MGEKKHKRRNTSERKRRKKQLHRRILLVVMSMLWVAGIVLVKENISHKSRKKPIDEEILTDEEWIGAPELDVQLLDVNPYSRPGIPLEKVKGIVVHYVGNPNTTAEANRNYFQGLKDAQNTHASSHFVVGLKGEIIQCVPSGEIAYASNNRNKDTLSIECCHPDDTGKFTEETYASAVQLTGWLCSRFGLESKYVIRHYDVTGKLCPKYFVEHNDEWEKFLENVDEKIKEINKMKK